MESRYRLCRITLEGYHYDRHLLPSDGRSVIGDGSISEETTEVSDGSDQCGDLENLNFGELKLV